MSEKEKHSIPKSMNKAIQPANSTKGNDFSTALQKILKDVQELCKNNEGLQDYQSLLRQQADLRREVEQRRSEVAEKNKHIHSAQMQKHAELAALQNEIKALDGFKDRLIQEYETRYTDWSGKEERNRGIAVENSQLKGELATSQGLASRLHGENNDLRTELKQLKGAHDHSQSQLSSLQDQKALKELKLKTTVTDLQSSQARVADLELKLGVIQLDSQQM
jgi:chromosome segregation ATPase